MFKKKWVESVCTWSPNEYSRMFLMFSRMFLILSRIIENHQWNSFTQGGKSVLLLMNTIRNRLLHVRIQNLEKLKFPTLRWNSFTMSGESILSQNCKKLVDNSAMPYLRMSACQVAEVNSVGNEQNTFSELEIWLIWLETPWCLVEHSSTPKCLLNLHIKVKHLLNKI